MMLSTSAMMAPAVDEQKRHPRSPAHSENTSADGHYRGLRSECYDALLIGRRSGCLCHVGGPAAVEIAEPEVVSDLGTTPGEEDDCDVTAATIIDVMDIVSSVTANPSGSRWSQRVDPPPPSWCDAGRACRRDLARRTVRRFSFAAAACLTNRGTLLAAHGRVEAVEPFLRDSEPDWHGTCRVGLTAYEGTNVLRRNGGTGSPVGASCREFVERGVGVESHWAAYVPIAPDIADVALIALTACRDRAHAAPTACCAHLLGPIPFRGRIASSPSTPRSLGCQR